MFLEWNISHGLALYSHLHTHTHTRTHTQELIHNVCSLFVQIFHAYHRYAGIRSSPVLHTHTHNTHIVESAIGCFLFICILHSFHWIVLCWVSSLFGTHAYLHIANACLCRCISVHSLVWKWETEIESDCKVWHVLPWEKGGKHSWGTKMFLHKNVFY